MSTSYKDFTGSIILNAHLEAKPGQADAIAKILEAIKENADSDKEPGCSTYRIARYGDKFAVFECYADQKAVETHFISDAFKELERTTYLAKSPSIVYYEEFGIKN